MIAMGPWSALACRWLPLPAVYGLKGNSVVSAQPAADLGRCAVRRLRGSGWRVHTPEVFPRADGTTYVCGLSSRLPLPADPAQVAPDPGACEELQRMASRFAPPLGDAEILAKPGLLSAGRPDGLPLLGRVAGVTNAFVATAHSVWGILNAPASGEALAELIVDGHAEPGRPFAVRPGAAAGLRPRPAAGHA